MSSPPPAGHDVVAFARADLDITDADAVRGAVRDTRPDAVINCAAWTNVDPRRATRRRRRGSTATVRATLRRPPLRSARTSSTSRRTTSSTGGDLALPRGRADGPIGAYGRSKLAGEIAVADAAPGHAIVRTAWVFGPHGKNFVDTMLRLGAERDELKVVDDQLGCRPTRATSRPRWSPSPSPAPGCAARRRGGSCTWWELAVRDVRASRSVAHRPSRHDAGFNAPAPRPAYSVLGSTRSDAPVLPAWQDGLAAHFLANEVQAT